MSKWTEREIGICIASVLISLCVGMIIGVLAENPEMIKTSDETHFNLTLYEKWDDLTNTRALEDFTLFHGYETYKMMRFSNGEQFFQNHVSNPEDAYILINADGDYKKVYYREYKEWLLNMNRIDKSYTKR